MHFCFINMPIEYYSPTCGGAIAIITANVAKELIALGHKVTILTRTNEEPLYDIGEVVDIQFDDSEVSLLEQMLCRLTDKIEKWDYKYFGIYRSKVCRALRQLGAPPDVVIVSNDFQSPKFIKQVFPKTDVVVWLHNEHHTVYRQPQELFQCIDKFVSCSNYIRNWTLDKYGLPTSKIATVMSGVDTQQFPPRSALARTLGSPLRLLYVGRLDPHKGVDIAVDAAEALVASGVKATLTIVGDVWFYAGGGPSFCADFKKTLLARISSLPYITYLGHRPRADLSKIYREHDVAFVLSRTNEPLGLVPMEAMAAGCAVIASNRGGLPEACGGAAILVNPDDIDSILQALFRFTRDDALLQQFKTNGRMRAESWTWQHCARQLCQSVAEPRSIVHA